MIVDSYFVERNFREQIKPTRDLKEMWSCSEQNKPKRFCTSVMTNVVNHLSKKQKSNHYLQMVETIKPLNQKGKLDIQGKL